jgi:serine/threonine protein kinase
VAIKVLPAEVAGDADRRARFEREARAVAALSHPNILALFDIGIEGDRHFVVTELLEGESLAERLRQGALPVRKAVEIAVGIARGLSAAHSKSIAHRDLKPANVFLLADGQVKLLDFGLARVSAQEIDATQTRAALTDPGMVMGTAGYMAPEQVRGQQVDGRADLFALGVVLYEMVTGHRAFARESAVESLNAILKDDPPELTTTRPDLPPALDRIVRHCLEKNPAERFQSARDVIFALDSIPAVLAITSDPYIVYTSNIFAMLGLRALYFVLSDVVQRFHYLRPGLAAIIGFVACKMLLAGTLDIPVGISLTVILAIFLAALAASWAFPKQQQAEARS